MAMTTLPHIRSLKGPEMLALLLLQRNADSDTPYRVTDLIEDAEPTPIMQALESLQELGLIDHPRKANGKPNLRLWDITEVGETLLDKKGARELAAITKHANATVTSAGLEIIDEDRKARQAYATKCAELMAELGLVQRAKPAPAPKPAPVRETARPTPKKRRKVARGTRPIDDGDE